MESGFRIPTAVISNENSMKDSINITRPGDKVDQNVVYLHSVNPNEFPETPLNNKDYLKRLRFDNLVRMRIDSISEWKRKDTKGVKKNHYINEVM